MNTLKQLLKTFGLFPFPIFPIESWKCWYYLKWLAYFELAVFALMMVVYIVFSIKYRRNKEVKE